MIHLTQTDNLRWIARLAAIWIVGFFSCLTLAQSSGPPAPSPCKIESVDFHGWNAKQVSNQWVKLILVPKLGGRLMQVVFGGHPYLFVNRQYLGQYHPPAEATAGHNWFNYGGDKIWPLPEGTEDEHHWPGPIADALDDGDYEFKILSEGANCRVRLEGPADPQTGLQYAREISIAADSPEIHFHAVMKNASGHAIEWSMQSVSQYDTSGELGGLNHEFRTFAPVHTPSAYLDGYYVRTGLANAPSYSVQDNLFSLHWLNSQGEVWLDSTEGWIAVADNAAHYAMVERFQYHADAQYPGKATIIFYSNGPTLKVDESGHSSLTKDDPDDAHHYLEAELNSPLIKLVPGESYAMDTAWFPTRIQGGVKDVKDAGLIFRPVQIAAAPKTFRLSGGFGVFCPGKLVVYFYNHDGLKAGSLTLQSVDPLEPVNLNGEIEVPPSSARISLHVIDALGHDRGSLGEAVVPPGSGGQ
jgi:hypothetical protein